MSKAILVKRAIKTGGEERSRMPRNESQHVHLARTTTAMNLHFHFHFQLSFPISAFPYAHKQLNGASYYVVSMHEPLPLPQEATLPANM